jgi:hypothetical protein
MKSIILAICAGVLFFLLSPATFFRLPPKGSKFAVAAVHATLFAFIFYVGYKYVSSSSVMEGLSCGPGQCKLKISGNEQCKKKDEKVKWKKDIDPTTNISNGSVTYKCGALSGQTGGAWLVETGTLGSEQKKDSHGYPITKNSQGFQWKNQSGINAPDNTYFG